MSNLSDHCSVCINNTSVLIRISSTDSKQVKWSSKLNKCVPAVDWGDDCCICLNCIEQLEIAYTFCNLCLQSYEVRKQQACVVKIEPDLKCLKEQEAQSAISDIKEIIDIKIEEFCTDRSYYSLLFDETINEAGAKECQFQVRYWSVQEEKVVTKHLNTSFIHRATAVDLRNKIEEVIDELKLPFRKMLMLGSDGPNVNKKLWRLINENVKLVNEKGLMDIGECSIHTLHNAFVKGLEGLGTNTSDLIIAVKYFFKDKPARWEDYEKFQNQFKVPQHTFLKHVKTRWLTIIGAAERILEQWPAMHHYFMKFIPTKCPDIEKTSTYKTIYNFFKMPSLKAEICFIISSAKLFTKFTGTFQRDEPLIHLVYAEIVNLLTAIARRFCIQKGINMIEKMNHTSDFEKIFCTGNLLELKKIEIGVRAKEELKKITEKEQLLFLNCARQHYLLACKHILTKSIVTQKPLLKYFRCLNPINIKSKKSADDITKITKCLPLDILPEEITDEWKLLYAENLPRHDGGAIDKYWLEIFNIKKENEDYKYPSLTKGVKCLLSLSHGNASVERGFSTSSNILTSDRANMSPYMLNHLLYIKDGLKTYENQVYMVPICKSLISSAQHAHKQYTLYLDAKKLEKDEKEHKRKHEEEVEELQNQLLKKAKTDKLEIDEIENQLKEKEKGEYLQSKVYEELYKEGNEKLKSALKNNNLIQANIAQSMIESANQMRQSETNRKNKLAKTRSLLEKKKSSLINAFIKRSQ